MPRNIPKDYHSCFEEVIETGHEEENISQGKELVILEAEPLESTESTCALEEQDPETEEETFLDETPSEKIFPFTKNMVVTLWENNLCISPIPNKGKSTGKGSKPNNAKSREVRNLLATWENEAKLAKRTVIEGSSVAQ